MLKAEKIEKLKILEQEFKSAKHFIFTEYKGLTVEQMNQLRKNLLQVNSKIMVVKDSLAKIAYKNAQIELSDEWFKGPVAIIFCKQPDFVKTVNVVYNFLKENEILKVKFGYLENEIYNAVQLKEISQIPSYERLIAKLVRVLNSPISSLVFNLKSILLKLILTLKAIEEKKK